MLKNIFSVTILSNYLLLFTIISTSLNSINIVRGEICET